MAQAPATVRINEDCFITGHSRIAQQREDSAIVYGQLSLNAQTLHSAYIRRTDEREAASTEHAFVAK
jgi:hypothetical protein